jgi:deazaflavin-dependent oxidoreductase (nitroreductase family)
MALELAGQQSAGFLVVHMTGTRIGRPKRDRRPHDRSHRPPVFRALVAIGFDRRRRRDLKHRTETASIMSNSHALRTTGVPALVPIFNPLIRRILGAGLPFGPNVLLTVRGRTSGLPRTVPVAVIKLDGHRYIQSPFGEVNWVRNLRAAGEAVVSKGRHREEVDAIEVTPEAGGPILRDALAPYLRSRLLAPLLRRFFPFRADSTLEDYVAEACRHPMFELRMR